MKIFFKITLIFALMVQVSSCIDFSDNIKKEKINSEDFKTITTNRGYSVQVPKYMKEATNLNEDASLQYQNIFKETYFVVIDEPKDEFKKAFIEANEYNDSISMVENYKNVQLEFFKESLSEYDLISEKSERIHDLDAKLILFDGKVKGIVYPISYQFTFVEGKEKVYMLMAWTLKDKKDTYRETFKYISDSFTVFN